MMFRRAVLSLGLGTAIWGGAGMPPAIALPPPDDIPEEVLRTEIVLEGRSPQTNQALSPQEYVELQQAMRESLTTATELPPQVRQIVAILKFRKGLRLLIPIIP